MANVTRDMSGKSDFELYASEQVRKGNHLCPEVTQFLLEEIRNLRRMIFEEKNLDLAIARQRAEIDDLQFVIEMKRKAALR